MSNAIAAQTVAALQAIKAAAAKKGILKLEVEVGGKRYVLKHKCGRYVLLLDISLTDKPARTLANPAHISKSVLDSLRAAVEEYDGTTPAQTPVAD